MMKNRLMLVFLFVLVGFSFGCQGTTTTLPSIITTTPTQNLTDTTIDLYDYSDFSSLILADPETQLSQIEDDYYLYFYGPTCSGCNTIKQEVLSIIDSLTGSKVYLVETHVIEDINENISISHTPALVHVINHLVESAYEGASDVLAVFQIME